MDSPDESVLGHFIHKNRVAVAIFVISLIVLGGGLIVLFLPQASSSSDVTFSLQNETTPSPSISVVSPSLSKKMLVDVSGAVLHPGVYEFSEGSRLQDAIVKAGGFSSQADNPQIARSLNLATKLRDGMKVYIPALGEQVPQTSDVLSAATESELVNLNTASSTELDSLPGIGKVTADKIVSTRPYQTVDELLSKKVVSSKVFGEIKDKVSVE